MKILFLLYNVISNCFINNPIDFYLDRRNIEINNLGNYGPDYNMSSCFYIKDVGIDKYGNIFDFNITADNYKINKIRNTKKYNDILRNNIIEIYIEIDNNKRVNKEFNISFYSNNRPLYLDYFYLSLLDIDLNANTLDGIKIIKENLCVRIDDIMIKNSFFPKSTDIIIQYNKSCNGKSVNYDTMLIKSKIHGSNCDNPVNPFNIDNSKCNNVVQSDITFQLAYYKKKSISFNIILECLLKNDSTKYINCNANRRFYITGRTSKSKNCSYDFEFNCDKFKSCWYKDRAYLNCGCCRLPENIDRCENYFNSGDSSYYSSPIYTAKSTTTSIKLFNTTYASTNNYYNNTTTETNYYKNTTTETNYYNNTTTDSYYYMAVVDDEYDNSKILNYLLGFSIGFGIFFILLVLFYVLLLIQTGKNNKISPELEIKLTTANI